MKLSILLFAAVFCLAQPPPSAAQTAPPATLKYKVGQRVEYVDNGKWYKSVIIAVRDDSADHYDHKLYAPYRVHPLGYNGNTDAWVCCENDSDRRTQLRPAGSGPTEPVPGGESNDPALTPKTSAPAAASAQPSAKKYHCVYYVGSSLIDAAPFTLTGSTTYTDSTGKQGTYNFIPSSATLTFHGGNYDGQHAEYEVSGGLPRLHILGPSGRRVIDCD